MIYSDAIFIKDPFDKKFVDLSTRDLSVIFVCAVSFQLYDYALEIIKRIDLDLKEKIKKLKNLSTILQ